MNNKTQFRVNALLRIASMCEDCSEERKSILNEAKAILDLDCEQEDNYKKSLEAIPKWILTNKPKKGKSFFMSYRDLFFAINGYDVENPCQVIKNALFPVACDFYIKYGIGLQFGAKSNDKRGLRIYTTEIFDQTTAY